MACWITAALALGLGACGTTASTSASAEAGLAARAKARWDLLAAGKLDEAYGYLSPGKRSVVTVEQYRGSIKPGMWREWKVDGIECGEPDLCKVKMLISYTYKDKANASSTLDVTRPLIETWRRQDGEWWFIQTD
mgnify:CR=1 FL=1